MHKVHKQRLLMLADALETRIPADRFDLSEWRINRAISPDLGDRPRGYVTDSELIHVCGTAACAVGWACALPEFQAEGLYWDGGMPYYKHGESGAVFDHFEAVNMFFDINLEESKHLFTAKAYGGKAGPLDVARRIRGFVSQAPLGD